MNLDMAISQDFLKDRERKKSSRTFPLVLREKCPFLLERPHREEYCATFIIESRLLAFTLQYIIYGMARYRISLHYTIAYCVHL